MKIIIIFLLFLSTLLFSNNISENDKYPIYKSIEIATNIKNIEDAINNPSKFKEKKYFRRYLQKKRIDKSSWYKIKLSNSSNKTLERMIFTKWDYTNIDVYFVINNKVTSKNTLKEYKNFQLSDKFFIKPEENLELYINVNIKKGIDDFYYLYIISQDVLPDLIVEKEMFHSGIFLGLLIAMMMYNFFMYFSMKIKCYLYLALHQLAIVIYVSDIRYFIVTFFDVNSEIPHYIFRVILPFLIPIFSILFTKEFLNTKEDMPFANKLLNIFIVIYILFHSFTVNTVGLVDYASFLYILYIIAGLYILKQGNKYAFFYILGFSTTVAFYIGNNLIRAFDINFYIEFINVIQILAVIEAFSLSMALYLKLKETVEEKEKAQLLALENEEMLLSQSRFATMGEMLASIAHQWKQPLAHLNIIFGNLLLAHQSNKLTQEYLEKKHYEADKQLKYMATTIKDFSNFFSTKNKIQKFILKDIYDETLELTSSRIEKLDVDVNLTIIDNKEHQSYKNELLQVFIIVFNNALDAVLLNNIKNRKIEVVLDGNEIHICDNAGGIPDEIINRIFEPYFSTKNKKFGTGLGLYTAKVITNNILNGEILVKNEKEGAKFTLKISNI